MPSTAGRKIILWTACCLALVGASAAWAQQSAPAAGSMEVAQASLLERRVSLDMKAQSVHSALLELARIAGVQMLVRDGGLQQKPMPGLRGDFSLRQALTEILGSSGYTFQQINEATIGIVPPAQERSGDPVLDGLLDLADAGGAAGAAAGTTADDILPTIALPDRPEPESGAGPRPRQSSPQLEEIIVTATKREQSAREIPVSIDAMLGADLEKTGAREMRDYLREVPGIALLEPSGDKPAKISIRGVGPTDGANQTTGVLLDDVPLTDPYGTFPIADPDPFDMRTVEILKGPQGTLFGASALNGAIRFVQNKPELDHWSGRGFAELLSIHEGGTEPTYGAVFNAPLGETVALRASGVLQHTPGVIDFKTPGHPEKIDGDDVEKWIGRLLARWDATDDLSLNASYMQQKRHIDESGFTTNFEGRLERDNAPTSSPTTLLFSVATLDARYDLGWATLVSESSRLTKRMDLRLDATYALANRVAQLGLSLAQATQDIDASGYLQEFRLVSSDSEPWSWLGGVYLNKYTADIDIDLFAANTGVLSPLLASVLGNNAILQAVTTENGISIANQHFHPLRADDRALFGEVSRTFSDAVTLTIGGRYYKVRVAGDTTTRGVLNLVTKQQLETNQYIEVADHGFSPKLALTWQAGEDVMIYANATRGFQYGGVNIQPANLNVAPNTHPTFKSSVLWNYEIGVRTDWFDRTLRADVTLFHIDWKKPQVFQADDGAIGINGIYIDNVGAARGNGVEGTLRYLTPIPGLSVRIGGSYIVMKSATEFATASGDIVPAGADMPLAPRVQAAAGISYANSLGPWQVGADLGGQHQGKAYNNVEHDFSVFDYSIINLNLSIARPDLPYAPSFALVAGNITDRRAFTGINGTTPSLTTLITGGDPPATYNRPRSIGLRVTMAFD
ncbi:TonB-dependent receptor domain-containing protein [Solimonas sp. K1W22B-7]|uniref:TonB-dependent receptor domain-containing protein n=1 Tax=Solimonas sp. K1W22B-7 TaxID=2303331 RepID=UPI0013C46C07|nr:TonB-dependent receptor [Solimonas sp. K1W22B-7]